MHLSRSMDKFAQHLVWRVSHISCQPSMIFTTLLFAPLNNPYICLPVDVILPQNIIHTISEYCVTVWSDRCLFRCNEVALEWNYSVEFGGVGSPPDDWIHVGHCSQYAVFRRMQKPDTNQTLSESLVYEQVCDNSCCLFQTVFHSP